MRLALLCALLLSACSMPIGPRYAMRLGFKGQVRYRANAVRPGSISAAG